MTNIKHSGYITINKWNIILHASDIICKVIIISYSFIIMINYPIVYSLYVFLLIYITIYYLYLLISLNDLYTLYRYIGLTMDWKNWELIINESRILFPQLLYPIITISYQVVLFYIIIQSMFIVFYKGYAIQYRLQEYFILQLIITYEYINIIYSCFVYSYCYLRIIYLFWKILCIIRQGASHKQIKSFINRIDEILFEYSLLKLK